MFDQICHFFVKLDKAFCAELCLSFRDDLEGCLVFNWIFQVQHILYADYMKYEDMCKITMNKGMRCVKFKDVNG